MYSDDRQSSRSPTNSRAGSYREGPVGRFTNRSDSGAYQQRSSIIEADEREDKEYDQPVYDSEDASVETPRPRPTNDDPYVSALHYRFRNRPKSDYVYSKPSGPPGPPPPPPPLPGSSASTNNGARTGGMRDAYESSIRPHLGGGRSANGSVSSNDQTIRLPKLRPVAPEQQNRYARSIANQTSPDGGSRTSNAQSNVRFNAPSPPPPPPTANRSSTRENGTNTGDNRAANIPERERNRPTWSSQMPPNPTVSAFDYDASDRYGYRGHSYRSAHMPVYSLDDIRNINVALSRSGIPLFPYERFSSLHFRPDPVLNSYFDSCYPYHYDNTSTSGPRRIIGEVVSACRFVEEEPTFSPYSSGTVAVQNVWNAIQEHQSFSSAIPPRPTVSFRDSY